VVKPDPVEAGINAGHRQIAGGKRQMRILALACLGVGAVGVGAVGFGAVCIIHH
jgi:hypothetical protein